MTSRVLIPADGTTRLFTVPFPYIHQSHVIITVNRVLQYLGANYEWRGPTQIEFLEPPSGVVEIYRKTPINEALVEFQNGAQLTEDELNLAVIQNLYLVQELKDYYEALIDGSLDKLVQNVNGGAGAVIDKVIQEVLGSELLASLQQRIVDIDTNADTINAQRIRLSTVEDIINSLTSDGGEIVTFLQDEQNARIEGDTAIVETLGLIGAKSGDSQSFIVDMDTVKVSPTESLGQRLNVITSSIGEAKALVATEQTARVTADEALATSISNVNARVDDAEALVVSEAQARANADGALASTIDGLIADHGDTRALILQEQQARAAGDAAEASARSTLQTKVNGNTSSIQTHASSIDGLKAQYTVKVDNNGYVSGFGLASTPRNGTPFAEFIVLADRFAIVTPGENPVVPFAADSKGVYMNDAYIRNLTVDKIIGGDVLSQWNFNTNGGRIVLDTGTHMKVIGVGFGVNSEFIEWFGPKMNINSCSRANAITYVTVNGAAYYGGSLSAGVLKNGAQSSQIGVNVIVETGLFGTNRKAKVVTASVFYSNSGWRTTSLGDLTLSGSFVVERSLNGGSWVQVASGTIGGNRTIGEYEPGMGYMHMWHASGSVTYTDNSTNDADYNYRTRVVSGVGWPYNLGGTRGLGAQNTSILSVES